MPKFKTQDGTIKKYFETQSRVVKALKSRKSLNREQLYAFKNIGTVPFSAMVNNLCVKVKVINPKGKGRTSMRYEWNGATPSIKIANKMVKAMREDRERHNAKNTPKTVISTEINSTASKLKQLEKSVEGMRPLFINVRDTYEGNFKTIRSNTQNITNLWEQVFQLERTIEQKSSSLLSRSWSRLKNFWRTKFSFRMLIFYFILYSALGTILTLIFKS